MFNPVSFGALGVIGYFAHPQLSQHNSLNVQLGPSQGWIIFEISWEPDFPVNNFARNNGKNRVIIKTIINITIDKTGQKYAVKGSIY